MTRQIWFTSDTHFGSYGIIRMDNRPFRNTTEMDKTLIDNWNSVVGGNDIVYHLGDVLHHSMRKHYSEILEQLHGHIHLIAGNHDDDLVSQWKNGHLTEKAHKKIVGVSEMTTFRDHKRCYILCHYPIVCYRNRFHTRGDNEAARTAMLYGHVHTTGEYDMLQNLIKRQETPMRLLNVGCMLHNYTPINMEDVMPMIDAEQGDM